MNGCDWLPSDPECIGTKLFFFREARGDGLRLSVNRRQKKTATEPHTLPFLIRSHPFSPSQRFSFYSSFPLFSLLSLPGFHWYNTGVEMFGDIAEHRYRIEHAVYQPAVQRVLDPVHVELLRHMYENMCDGTWLPVSEAIRVSGCARVSEIWGERPIRGSVHPRSTHTCWGGGTERKRKWSQLVVLERAHLPGTIGHRMVQERIPSCKYEQWGEGHNEKLKGMEKRAKKGMGTFDGTHLPTEPPICSFSRPVRNRTHFGCNQ
jgi:hypothetical protein